MTEGTSTSGATAGTETAGPVAAVAASAASAAAPAPADAHVAAMATAAAATAAPSVPSAQPDAPAVGPVAAAVAAAEAAAAVEAAAAKKAAKAKKADADSDETSMSDAEMLPEVELASLGEGAAVTAGAAAAGQAGLPCGVFPVVDAAAPPIGVPIDGGGGFALSPLLLGALGLGALGLGFLLLRDNDDNDDDEEEVPPPPPPPAPANQPPEAEDDTAEVDEGETVTGDVGDNDTDPDGDEGDLTFALNEPVDGLTLNEDGTFTFDASAAGLDNLGDGETQTVTAEYTVTDADGATDTATLTITVNGLNDGPVAADETIAANEDGDPVTGTLDATDADGDDLTFAETTDVAGLDINADGTFTFDPADGAFADLAAGETRVVTGEFTVTDESGESDTGTITVTVTGVNDAPILTVQEVVEIDENDASGNVIVDAEAVDPDGEDVRFSISGEDAAFFSIDPLTGEVRINEPADFETNEQFTIVVTATDVAGASDSQTVTINVNNLVENEAPVLTVDNAVNIDENQPASTVVVDADATDADGEDVRFSLEGEDAALFNIDPLTGEVRLRQSADFETDRGPFNITVVATDVAGNEDREDVVVTINDVDENVNNAPVITVDNAVNIDENEPASTVVVDAAATDPDGDVITFSLAGDDAAFFNINARTGEVRLNQSADAETRSRFDITVIATDPDGLSDSEDVVVTINDVDEGGGPTTVLLDNVDDDGNADTPNTEDASGGAFIFLDDDDRGSFTIITGFGPDDTLVFEEGADVSFGTSGSDQNDLEIIVNNGGTVSQVILDDVLADDAGLVFNEATAEAEVGFDFFSQQPLSISASDNSFA